jgi:hypothetical protein
LDPTNSFARLNGSENHQTLEKMQRFTKVPEPFGSKFTVLQETTVAPWQAVIPDQKFEADVEQPQMHPLLRQLVAMREEQQLADDELVLGVGAE